MGACETTPHTAQPGNTNDPRPANPANPRREPLPRLRWPAAARRRPARSSSPLRGSGRSSWTPDHAAAGKTAAISKRHKAVRPARQPHASHRARTPRPLTARVPMGALMWPRRPRLRRLAPAGPQGPDHPARPRSGRHARGLAWRAAGTCRRPGRRPGREWLAAASRTAQRIRAVANHRCGEGEEGYAFWGFGLDAFLPRRHTVVRSRNPRW